MDPVTIAVAADFHHNILIKIDALTVTVILMIMVKNVLET